MARSTSVCGMMSGPRAFLAATLIMAVAASAPAGPVGFTVGGTTYSVARFDELPGNVLSVDALTIINAAGPTGTTGPFTSYYQARVILRDASNDALSVPGQVTILARFNETATNALVNGVPQNTFNLASDQTGSYFNIYYNPNAVANDLTGKGFGPDAAGATLIYSGALPTGGPSGRFQITSPSPENFDQSPNAATNGYGGKLTVVGSGDAQVNMNSILVNGSILTAGVGLGSVLNFSSMDRTPFNVAPSESFYDVTSGTYITPSLPFVNGFYQQGGPTRQDFQFEADAISTFGVPEPASIATTLLGLVGTGVLALGRRKIATV